MNARNIFTSFLKKKSNFKFGAIAIAIIVILSFSLTGFKTVQLPEEGFKVGDVIYSILPPDQFKQEHGDGWRIMNGTPFTPNDQLMRKYHPASSPNGVFIRGMNVGRDAGSGDPDGNRTVGAYQGDSFKSHHHLVGYPYGAFQFHGFYTNGNGTYQVDLNHNTSASQDVGGNETRPRNIALYIYIKVN